MQNDFQLGDYVVAEDWCYGRIVYINNEYAEIDFVTLHGGGCLTFNIKDIKFVESKDEN